MAPTAPCNGGKGAAGFVYAPDARVTKSLSHRVTSRRAVGAAVVMALTLLGIANTGLANIIVPDDMQTAPSIYYVIDTVANKNINSIDWASLICLGICLISAAYFAYFILTNSVAKKIGKIIYRPWLWSRLEKVSVGNSVSNTKLDATQVFELVKKNLYNLGYWPDIAKSIEERFDDLIAQAHDCPEDMADRLMEYLIEQQNTFAIGEGGKKPIDSKKSLIAAEGIARAMMRTHSEFARRFVNRFAQRIGLDTATADGSSYLCENLAFKGSVNEGMLLDAVIESLSLLDSKRCEHLYPLLLAHTHQKDCSVCTNIKNYVVMALGNIPEKWAVKLLFTLRSDKYLECRVNKSLLQIRLFTSISAKTHLFFKRGDALFIVNTRVIEKFNILRTQTNGSLNEKETSASVWGYTLYSGWPGWRGEIYIIEDIKLPRLRHILLFKDEGAVDSMATTILSFRRISSRSGSAKQKTQAQLGFVLKILLSPDFAETTNRYILTMEEASLEEIVSLIDGAEENIKRLATLRGEERLQAYKKLSEQDKILFWLRVLNTN